MILVLFINITIITQLYNIQSKEQYDVYHAKSLVKVCQIFSNKEHNNDNIYILYRYILLYKCT